MELIKKDILMNVCKQAPAPSKDYINLEVSKTHVMWRHWKINPHCLKPDVRVTPVDQKDTHADFMMDKGLQDNVKQIFGKPTLSYVKALCSGQYDFLPRLSKPLQIYIASYLELEDIAALSQVSKHFNEICNSEKLWEHIVERSIDMITPELRVFANDVGWKEVFFTNKLQLQLQLRRRKEQEAM